MKERIKNLFHEVTKDRLPNPRDWKLVWNGDPWCRMNPPTVFMAECETYEGTAMLLLHELAHAELGGGHPVSFWEHLEMLSKKYLGIGLDDTQIRMRSHYI